MPVSLASNQREELQCDVTVQLQVLGLVDGAHAALAELLDDPVVGDGPADHGWPQDRVDKGPLSPAQGDYGATFASGIGGSVSGGRTGTRVRGHGSVPKPGGKLRGSVIVSLMGWYGEGV